MDIIDLNQKQPNFPEGLALCLGTFDGLHLGHQRLIIEACLAGEGQVGVLLFKENPANFLTNGKTKAILTSLEDQISILRRLRVDVVLTLDVNAAFFALSPEEFIAQYLKPLHLNLLVVGEDFRFGKAAAGTPKTLAKSFPVLTVPLLEENGVKISTSLIKQDLLEGKVEEANRMLGRPYEVHGKGEIVVLGGAAIIAYYSFRAVSCDVDAVIDADSEIFESIRSVGERFNLDPTWLNDAFKQTESYSPKLVQYSMLYRTFCHCLSVRFVTGSYLVATKLKSFRPYRDMVLPAKSSAKLSPKPIRLAPRSAKTSRPSSLNLAKKSANMRRRWSPSRSMSIRFATSSDKAAKSSMTSSRNAMIARSTSKKMAPSPSITPIRP